MKDEGDRTIMEYEVTEKKGITGSTLKIIACVIMLIDHIGAVILESFLNRKMTGLMDEAQMLQFLNKYGAIYYTDLVMRLVGRVAFPIFCFLLVEGFCHTRNVKKYALNLGIFALISEIPFNLAFATSLGQELQYGVFYPGYQNVFFTLFLSLLTLCGYKYLEEHRAIYTQKTSGKVVVALAGVLGGAFIAYFVGQEWSDVFSFRNMNYQTRVWLIAAGIFVLILLAVVFYGMKHGASQAWNLSCDLAVLALGIWAAEYLKTDYAGIGIITVAGMYFLRKDKARAMTLGCAILTIFNTMEITSFFALFPIKKYNGERGLKMKYFFYAFYPVHLLILYFIARIIIR